MFGFVRFDRRTPASWTRSAGSCTREVHGPTPVLGGSRAGDLTLAGCRAGRHAGEGPSPS